MNKQTIKYQIFKGILISSLIILLIILCYTNFQINKLSLELNKPTNVPLENNINLSNNTINEQNIANISISEISDKIKSHIDLNESINNIDNSNWCKSGTIKIINNKEYIIKGLTIYKGHNLCEAYITTSNSKTTHYFSENNNINYEISVSN